MEKYFQGDKKEEDIKQVSKEEGHIEEQKPYEFINREGEIWDKEENEERKFEDNENTVNEIEQKQFNNQNIINNKRNYNNTFNQGQRIDNKPNSMNLNRIQNINNIPFQTQRINEPQNIFNDRIPNLNFNNYPVYNDNQNYYQNQIFNPNYPINNNFAQLNDFNNLNLSQNIYSNYYPQFNKFNPYNNTNVNNYYPKFNNFNPYIQNINYNSADLEINKLLQKIMEIQRSKCHIQNQSLDNNQQEFILIYKNNDEQEDEKKYKERIESIYNRNLKKANETLKNKKKVFLTENLENKEEIIIYITKNNDYQFIEKLNEIKAVKFVDLEVPKITYENIEQKIKNAKYQNTEEDNILLKDYEYKYNYNSKNSKYYNNNSFLHFNDYMFYSKNNISLFTPHIIRAKKNIISLFLPNKLNLSDFQYTDFHQKINNDVFLNLLQLRISQFNDYEKNNGQITDKSYNEKIFGFYKNISEKAYYLYSIMDKKIISEKFQRKNINSLFENLIASESQIFMSKKSNTKYNYGTFNKNMDFLKGLSYEELILYIILNKIENKYEIFPRILFYEYYLTITGEKVVVSNKIEPGYSEADYAFYSKCDYEYEEEPFIIQKRYQYNNVYTNLSYSTENFKIKSNTLYFIELKSSFNFSGEEDKEKMILAYKEFFIKLFNKYKEFIHLYKSKNWIKEDTKREILLIYDNDIIDISSDIEDIINNLLKENTDCIFKIIYTLKSYPYFSHSVAIRKHSQITQKYEKLSKEFEESKKREEEMSKKIEEILKENKEIKEYLLKKNGAQINNNKMENNEKKNKVSQNINSQNEEIKNNLTNKNSIENSEVTNLGKNNNKIKKDEN